LAAIEPAAGAAGEFVREENENLQAFLSDSLKARISDSMRSAPNILKKAEAPKLHHKVSVGNGETIAGVLQKTGVDGKDAYHAVKALGKHYDPRKVRSGQKIDVHFVYGRVAKIETSLYGSAARADIPSAIIAEMIRIYSWNVDFQRDIRRGDTVRVMYEAYENEDGDFAKYGNIPC